MSKILIIQESKWLHGNAGKSTLLDNKGCMCCLGFYGKSLGAKDKDIFDHGTPAACPLPWHPKLLDDEHFNNSKFCRNIISLNDNPETQEDLDGYLADYYHSARNLKVVPLSFKKMRLTEMFAEMDIKLEFVP